MAKYQATADCVFDGLFHAAGDIFEGRDLEGYDKQTAPYLEVIEEFAPAVTAKRGKKAADDDL